MIRKSVLTLALLVALGAAPARAQWIVHDPTSYGALIRETQTALQQLDELRAQLAQARRLYDGFNSASGAGSLAPGLGGALRQVIPDAGELAGAGGGDFARLGELGRRAAALRQAYRPGPDAGAARAELDRTADQAARDLALGMAVAQAGDARREGLTELLSAVDAAPNVRAVIDLQARIAAEQALGANDQLRLQGLAMAQEAEARLRAHRERERAAARAAARLSHFERGFR